MADTGTFPRAFEDKLNSALSAQAKEKLSRALSQARAVELESNPVAATFDRKHFSEIHRRLFQDVSSHAGVIRDYDLSKDGFGFADQSTMDYILDKELPERLATLDQNVNDLGSYQRGMAELHDSLDEAHPFREGNGRATRVFMGQVAERHGYTLDFNHLDQSRWVKACQDAISNDNTDKIAIMKDVVQPGKERAIKIAVQEIKKTDCREEKLAIVQRLTDRGITRDEIYQTQQEFKKSNDPNISR